MHSIKWQMFDEGKTISQLGSENGLIMLDEEHVDGARITLERDCVHAPFSITCGIYGWMFHTRFFSDEPEAQQEFASMKVALEKIIDLIPNQNDPEADSKMGIASESIQKFVEDYP